MGLGSPKATLEEGALRGGTWVIGVLKLGTKLPGRQGRGVWGSCSTGVSSDAGRLLPETQLQWEGDCRRHHTVRAPPSCGDITWHPQPWPPACFRESRSPAAKPASVQPFPRLSSHSATWCSLKTRHPRSEGSPGHGQSGPPQFVQPAPPSPS